MAGPPWVMLLRAGQSSKKQSSPRMSNGPRLLTMLLGTFSITVEPGAMLEGRPAVVEDAAAGEERLVADDRRAVLQRHVPDTVAVDVVAELRVVDAPAEDGLVRVERAGCLGHRGRRQRHQRGPAGIALVVDPAAEAIALAGQVAPELRPGDRHLRRQVRESSDVDQPTTADGEGATGGVVGDRAVRDRRWRVELSGEVDNAARARRPA